MAIPFSVILFFFLKFFKQEFYFLKTIFLQILHIDLINQFLIIFFKKIKNSLEEPTTRPIKGMGIQRRDTVARRGTEG